MPAKKEYDERVKKGLCTSCGGKKEDTVFNNCLRCRESHATYLIKHNRECWGKKIVRSSRASDKKAKRYAQVETDFITSCILHILRVEIDNRCPYCKILMQTKYRKIHDGVTVERLNNAIGHSKKNCILCCHGCNSRRFSDDFKKSKYNLKKSTDYLKKRKVFAKTHNETVAIKFVKGFSVFTRRNFLKKLAEKMEPMQRYPRMIYLK
jgi:hypothetical protein